MDVFSHALWTNILYTKARRYALWGVLFGVLPDFVSFGPLFLQRAFFPEDAPHIQWGSRDPSQIPQYIYTLYNWTHSLAVFFAVFAVSLFIFRRIWWPMFGWGFHILIDIFTHTSRFFPTPFLWPVSNFKVSVVSWGNPIFLTVNVALLASVYFSLYIIRRRRKMRSESHEPTSR